MKSQVLHILIPNEATGYKVVELSGWTGKCFVCPRTELKGLAGRSEIHAPGIYFLFGEADESTNQKLYIGESERFFDRLQTHDATKVFWNTAIIFTGGLDKAKVKYLEFLSTSEAEKAGRYDLMNSVSPTENSLSECDVVTTKDYFEKMGYVLSALSMPVFKKIIESISDSTLYFIKTDNADARAQLLADGSLNVLKGSLVRIRETDSFEGWALSARKKFVEDGTLKIHDQNSYIFTRDVLFKSPSAAGSVVKGRSTNGWTAWKDGNNNSLDENLRR